jgi:hypothetical protein
MSDASFTLPVAAGTVQRRTVEGGQGVDGIESCAWRQGEQGLV